MISGGLAQFLFFLKSPWKCLMVLVMSFLRHTVHLRVGKCNTLISIWQKWLLPHLYYFIYPSFHFIQNSNIVCSILCHDPDNHDGVITHLEPDTLECEVKWALESITTNKACGGDGIPVELFQILKDDAVKVMLHSICQQIGKTQAVATGLEKVSFHSNPKERQCQRMFKLPHNCTHLTC